MDSESVHLVCLYESKLSLFKGSVLPIKTINIIYSIQFVYLFTCIYISFFVYIALSIERCTLLLF
jgi:hypothetical protein